MSNSSWAARARHVIAQVKRENPEAKGEELKKLLSAAYPFGDRAYHPYKMWLKEVKKATTQPKVVFDWPEPRNSQAGQGMLI